MKRILLISAASALMLLTGCNNNAAVNNQSVSNKTVKVTGIRKASLNEGSQNLPVVTYNAPSPMSGKVKLLKPSYVTAPPMIPHSIKGMTPITIKRNQCLMCHLPQNAKALGAIPMPKDHFVDNFDGNKHIRRVAGSRYFCTTCHDRQANLNPAVENQFESMKASAGLK